MNDDFCLPCAARHEPGDALTLLEGFARRASLIAFDAAIAAARAGERERAFSVVAAEAGSLARCARHAVQALRGPDAA